MLPIFSCDNVLMQYYFLRILYRASKGAATDAPILNGIRHSLCVTGVIDQYVRHEQEHPGVRHFECLSRPRGSTQSHPLKSPAPTFQSASRNLLLPLVLRISLPRKSRAWEIFHTPRVLILRALRGGAHLWRNKLKSIPHTRRTRRRPVTTKKRDEKTRKRRRERCTAKNTGESSDRFAAIRRLLSSSRVTLQRASQPRCSDVEPASAGLLWGRGYSPATSSLLFNPFSGNRGVIPPSKSPMCP